MFCLFYWFSSLFLPSSISLSGLRLCDSLELCILPWNKPWCIDALLEKFLFVKRLFPVSQLSYIVIFYRFKCIDLDGNGVITHNEMQYFYEEQLHRMECMALEPVPFEDILCQIVDMIAPEVKYYFSLNLGSFSHFYFSDMTSLLETHFACRGKIILHYVIWKDANFQEMFSIFFSILISSWPLKVVIHFSSVR
jgi:hypothetical protein